MKTIIDLSLYSEGELQEIAKKIPSEIRKEIARRAEVAKEAARSVFVPGAKVKHLYSPTWGIILNSSSYYLTPETITKLTSPSNLVLVCESTGRLVLYHKDNLMLDKS